MKDPGAEGEASVLLRECRFPQGWGCYEGAGTAAWGVTTEEAHNGRKSVHMKITGHDQRPITNNAVTLGATAQSAGRYVQSRVRINRAGEPFCFRSPADGVLDYILLCLWDRGDQTPSGLWTPMDVYREAVEKKQL